MHHRDHNPEHREHRRHWQRNQGEQEEYRDFSDRWEEPRPFFEQRREQYRNYPERQAHGHHDMHHNQGWHPSDERQQRFGQQQEHWTEEHRQPAHWHNRGEDFGPHNQHAADRWTQPIYRPYYQGQPRFYDDYFEEDRERFRG